MSLSEENPLQNILLFLEFIKDQLKVEYRDIIDSAKKKNFKKILEIITKEKDDIGINKIIYKITIDCLYDEINKIFENKDYSKGRKLLDEIIKIKSLPNKIKGNFLYLDCSLYLAENNLNKAFELILEAFQLDSKNELYNKALSSITNTINQSLKN